MAKKRKRNPNKKLITLGLVAIGGYFLLQYIAARTARKISYGSPSLSIWSLKGGNVEFRIKLPILNESDVPAKVTGFLGQIFYSQNVVGQVSLINPVDIPGFGNAIVEFRMIVGLGGAAYQLYQILQSGQPLSAANLKIIGTLKINHLPIDVNTPLI